MDQLHDRRDDDTVAACPFCDSTSLNTAANDEYRCTTCGRKVADPVERDRDGNTEPGNKGAAKTLADAEPDSWP